jgi:hypothetical protein
MKPVLRLPNDPELAKLRVNCSNDAQMVKENLRVPPLMSLTEIRQAKSENEKALIKKAKLNSFNKTLRDQFIETIVNYKRKVMFNIVFKVA